MKRILWNKLLAGVLSLAMLCNLGFTPVMASAAQDSGPVDSGAAAPAEKTITAFAPLAEDIRYQSCAARDLVLPGTLLATVNGAEAELPVTWDGVPKLGPGLSGLFVLTANVGDFALANGAELPIITVFFRAGGRIAGLGTAASPLQITNEGQLREIAALVNNGELERFILGEGSTGQVYMKLMNDITLSGEWTPIGADTGLFDGVFDGNGKTIFGLKINQPDMVNVGLFGITGNTSSIKDLTLHQVQITGRGNTGGLVGYAYGTLQGCTVSGSVNGTAQVGGVAGGAQGSITGCTANAEVSGSGDAVGGVAGGAQGNVTFCSASGNVSGVDSIGGVVGLSGEGSTVSGCFSAAGVSGRTNVGGVVGTAQGNVTLCSASGNVSGVESIGGVVGVSQNAKDITSCYATGNVRGTGSIVGGVVGMKDRGTVSGCYATGEVRGNGDVGGVAGKVTSNSNVINCAALNPRVAAETVFVGRVVGTRADSFPVGANAAFAGMMDKDDNNFPEDDGSRNNGMNIADIVTLDGKFDDTAVWTSFEETTLPALVGVGPQSVMRPGHLLEFPQDYDFSGGNGLTANTAYQITTERDLRALAHLVNSGNDYAGKYFKQVNGISLTGEWTPIGTVGKHFSGIFNGGGNTISGLKINEPGMDNVGLFGITGTGSMVKNVDVRDASVTGKSNVGGVVGYAGGTVTGCSVSGKVSGEDENIGGVVGMASGDSFVASCYATGDVSGTNNVGGVVGHAGGGSTVTGCYATGAVRGEGDNVGGVVGRAGGTVIGCAALNPSVSGNTNVGRVVDNGSGSTGNIAFAGMKVTQGGSDKPLNKGENTPDGKDIQNLTTLDGKFDDETVWTDFDSTTLPALVGVGQQTVARPAHLLPTGSGYAFSGGTGAEGDAYQIKNEAELRALAGLVNSGDAAYSSAHYQLIGDITLTGEWTPIGTVTNGFGGVFDGAGHSISGLKIDQPNGSFLGLFGYTAPGSAIQNLRLLRVEVNGKDAVGGVVGFAEGAVANCSVTGVVAGTEPNSGGVVGAAENTVTGCHFAGGVSGGNNVGGVVGFAAGAVTGCSAGGTVRGTGNGTGGVVGFAQGAVTSCYATADVRGEGTFVGGVAGHAQGVVTSCYATGTVSGSILAGGVVGAAEGTVTKCAALNAKVAGDSDVGRVFSASQITVGKDNVAFVGMTLLWDDREVTPRKGADEPGGADVTLAEIKTAAWWQARGFTAPTWITADGKLPVLVSGANDDLPIYLTPTFHPLPTLYEATWFLTAGYSAAARDLPITSTTRFTVSKLSGNEKITMNGSELNAAPGLPVGQYPVELLVTNTAGSATLTFTLVVKQAPVPVSISGPTAMRLTEGYAETHSEPFTITGTAPVEVKLQGAPENIRWDNASQTLTILPGLKAGVYAFTIVASNEATAGERHVFTLTVAPKGGGSSGGSGASVSSWKPETDEQASKTVTAAELKDALEQMKQSGKPYALIQFAGSIMLPSQALKELGKTPLYVDTVDGAVQVRVIIPRPDLVTEDLRPSGAVKGARVENLKAFFEKWFQNKVRIVCTDQTGTWGQRVEIAAKVDLTDMNTSNLYIYRFDRKTNTYILVQRPGKAAPGYWLDKNGYLHFYTTLAGDYIISEGPLAAKK